LNGNANEEENSRQPDQRRPLKTAGKMGVVRVDGHVEVLKEMNNQMTTVNWSMSPRTVSHPKLFAAESVEG